MKIIDRHRIRSVIGLQRMNRIVATRFSFLKDFVSLKRIFETLPFAAGIPTQKPVWDGHRNILRAKGFFFFPTCERGAKS